MEAIVNQGILEIDKDEIEQRMSYLKKFIFSLWNLETFVSAPAPAIFWIAAKLLERYRYLLKICRIAEQREAMRVLLLRQSILAEEACRQFLENGGSFEV